MSLLNRLTTDDLDDARREFHAELEQTVGLFEWLAEAEFHGEEWSHLHPARGRRKYHIVAEGIYR